MKSEEANAGKFGQPSNDQVPPLWITSRHGDLEIDPRVIEAAHKLWPWAWHYVRRELGDPTRAAEIVEEVAARVFRAFRANAEVGRNLRAYVATSFINLVRDEAIKERRTDYVGLLRELENRVVSTAADWVRSIHARLVMRLVIGCMDDAVRRMFFWRQADYTWAEIGEVLGITAHQAKCRFDYGVKKAYNELQRLQAKKADQERPA